MALLEENCSLLAGHTLPRWAELPDLPLYMDQVLGLMERYLGAYPGFDGKGLTASMVNNYVKQNINVIFDVDVLNQLIVNYFENNKTIINQYISEYTGIISNVVVDNEVCVITLNNKQTIQLTVYDAYARVRDRVQSIVVVPNSKGHITHPVGYDYINVNYIVTPASMATVIADRMSVSVKALDSSGNITDYSTSVTATTDGTLTASINWLKNSQPSSIALYVKDSGDGGTDYTTSFTPIDWVKVAQY